MTWTPAPMEQDLEYFFGNCAYATDGNETPSLYVIKDIPIGLAPVEEPKRGWFYRWGFGPGGWEGPYSSLHEAQHAGEVAWAECHKPQP